MKKSEEPALTLRMRLTVCCKQTRSSWWLVNRTLFSLVKVSDTATIKWLVEDSVAYSFLYINRTQYTDSNHTAHAVRYGSYVTVFVVVCPIARRISGKGGSPGLTQPGKVNFSRKVMGYGYCVDWTLDPGLWTLDRGPRTKKKKERKKERKQDTLVPQGL